MVCVHYCELFFYLLWILRLLIGSHDDLVRQQVGVVYLSEDKFCSPIPLTFLVILV